MTTANSTLLNNDVRSLYVDVTGTVWAGSIRGVNSFPVVGIPSTFTQQVRHIYPPVDSLHKPDTVHTVSSITSSLDGSLWFNVPDGGVSRYSPKNTSTDVWQHYDTLDLPAENVRSIAAENLKSGEVWVTGNVGIGRYTPHYKSGTTTDQGGTWRKYTMQNAPIPNDQRLIVAVNPYNQKIWFATYEQGLFSYNADYDEWSVLNIPEQQYDIHAMSFDSKYIWFGSAIGACSVDLVTHAATSYPSRLGEKTIPRNPVLALAVSLTGEQSFGTQDSGLVVHHDTTWTRFMSGNSPLPSNRVNALVYDAKGNLWIGTDQGIAVYNAGNVK